MRIPAIRQNVSHVAVRTGPKRETLLARKTIAGLLLGSSLLWAGLAWAGVPAVNSTEYRVPSTEYRVSQPHSVLGTDFPARLYGRLASKVAGSPSDSLVRVIVHLKDQADLSKWSPNDRTGAIRTLKHVADMTQPQLVAALQAVGNVSVYQRYWIFNGFAIEAPVSVVQQLAARDDVSYIIEDGSFQQPREPVVDTGRDDPTNNWNIYEVRGPQTWALGFDGAGRTVANLDSGVDSEHQALASRWRGILPGHSPADSWLDPFNLSPQLPTASGPHGTYTMGTIAGYYGNSTGPNEIGQAKGAAWIACRIYDESGKGPFSYMHACFQFMADPDGNPNTNDQPDAVGNSWGDSLSDSYPDLEWYPDVLAWQAVGVIPVFSAGNSGGFGAGSIREPASYPMAISVGALSTERSIAGFSSRGPAENLPPWNDPNNWQRSDWNLIKPEVVAPGVYVRTSIPGNSYGTFNGTSMSSPHVTGLAGILRQIRPDLSVNEFYNIIIDTAYWSSDWGTRPNNNYGWGEIDDYAAAVYVRDAGAVSGQIMDGSCNTPVPGVDVRVYDNTPGSRARGVGIRRLYSDNTGHYRTILSAGAYTVTVSAPGYYDASFGTVVTLNTTTTLPITLAKMATGVVSGIVTDGTTPVSGATVSVYGLSNMRTTTDASGHYILRDVPDGTFTLQAEKCGYATARITIHVTYPDPLAQDVMLGPGTTVLADDFESGTMANWTVNGGSTSTAIWHNSMVRSVSGSHAARAGIPTQPTYNGAADTYMTSTSLNTSQADQLWLSFNLYDSAESEYDILRTQISTNGGTSWITVQGQASPVHGWQTICLNLTNWKSATMLIRFYFHSDSGNWNNQVFEGPSIDDVRLSASSLSGTPVPAQTPTPGTPIPCAPATGTATPPVTPTPGNTPVLVGHVTWQGRPAQPDSLQQLPVTLTLKLGITEANYPPIMTDAGGFFTVTIGSLVPGNYSWRAKGPRFLANSGTVAISGASETQVEIGLMLVGDANNDNLVNTLDFNIIKPVFGKSCGDPGYDDRAEFTGDCLVNIFDFNLLKVNFGRGGAPPLMPRL